MKRLKLSAVCDQHSEAKGGQGGGEEGYLSLTEPAEDTEERKILGKRKFTLCDP